jgi:hypothetical protein
MVAAPAGCSGRGPNGWTPAQGRRGVAVTASAGTTRRRWNPAAWWAALLWWVRRVRRRHGAARLPGPAAVAAAPPPPSPSPAWTRRVPCPSEGRCQRGLGLGGTLWSPGRGSCRPRCARAHFRGCGPVRSTISGGRRRCCAWKTMRWGRRSAFLAEKSGPPGARELSSTFPALLFPPDSPSAPRGAGDDMGSSDGWKPKSERKRGSGGATGQFFAIRMNKRAVGGLVGETAGDALRIMRHSKSNNIHWYVSIMSVSNAQLGGKPCNLVDPHNLYARNKHPTRGGDP